MENKDLNAMIEKIVQDPSFAELVGSMRQTEKTADTPAVGADMMKKLPDVLAMLQPMLGGQTEAAKQPLPSGDAMEAEGKKSSSGVPAVTKKYDKNKAQKLLSAIKPYLNPSRCAIIDRCVSVMQITDVMQALEGLDGLEKNGWKGGS